MAFKHCIRQVSLLACAVAGAALGSPALAEDFKASMQVSLIDLQYRLVDLTPDDGETPWITFHNQEWLHVNFNNGAEQGGDLPSRLVSNAFGSITDSSGWNSAERAPGVIKVSSKYDHEDLLGQPASDVFNQAALYHAYDNLDPDLPHGPDIPEPVWSISSNTRLILEGSIRFEGWADATSLIGHPLLTGPDSPYLYAAMGGNGSVRMHLDGYDANGIVISDSIRESASAIHTVRASVEPLDRDVLNSTIPLYLSLDNSSDALMRGRVTLSMIASTWGYKELRMVEPPPPIPEPQSIALTVCGLAVVAIAGIRKKSA